MTQRSSTRRNWIPRAAALGLALWCSACGTEFDSIAQLEGVRILGVQKSDSYAQPGDTVQMRMLVHDTGVRQPDEAEGEPRELSLLWLSGCENPPGDLFALCFEQFGEVLAGFGSDFPFANPEGIDPAQLVELTSALQEAGIGFGFGEEFSFDVSPDIIDRRPPTDPQIRRYGLSYTFFAACAGNLGFNSEPGEFPVTCSDDDGNELTERDFVAGYSAVYSFAGLSNRNPAVLGMRVDGKRVAEDRICIGADCETLVPDPDRECDPSDPVIEVCEDADDVTKCETLDVEVIVDADSVEIDEATAVDGDTNLTEQMWVNYHTDRGKMKFDLALVNDATAGFNDDPKTEYIAPTVKGPAHIWAVVRDNRGGTDWARVSVCVD